MRIAIIGTGAIGAYYGARLQCAGNEVHFLLRSDADHVRRHGLLVESPNGDMHLTDIHVWDDAGAMPPCELVLVALKTTANQLLPQLLRSVVGPGSQVVLLQNGLGVEEDIGPQLGPEVQLHAGLCFICSHKIGPGHIRHHEYGRIALATWRQDGQAAGIGPELHAIASCCQDAGLDIQLLEDLSEARWRKLCWNVPYNGLCVVLNTTTDCLMAHPQSRALVRALMEEVQAGAKACGITIEDSFLDTMCAYTDGMAPYKPSMLLDHHAGRPLESEAIYARPIACAAAAGCALPATQALYRQLCFLDPHCHEE